MKNELLKIGPFTVYGYGLMIAVGILAAYFTGERRAKKRGLPYEHVFNLVVWCVLGGFLGAKILYWITEWKSIVANPGFLGDTLTDGFVVFGGIIGGILTAYVYCRIKNLDFLRFFDTLMLRLCAKRGGTDSHPDLFQYSGFHSLWDFAFYSQKTEKGRGDGRGLSDFLQCGKVCAGVFQRGSGERKCRGIVYLTVYFPVYFRGRNSPASCFQ